MFFLGIGNVLFSQFQELPMFPQQTHLPVPFPHKYTLPSMTLSISSGFRKRREVSRLQGRRVTSTQLFSNVRSWPSASILKVPLWFEMPIPGPCPRLAALETLGTGPSTLCCQHCWGLKATRAVCLDPQQPPRSRRFLP